MTRVAVIGSGVVGATVAYELSRQPQFEVHIVDAAHPAQGSTQAALGVLMGIISHKVKGRNWRLRRDSIERYRTLIPELEEQLGRPILHNRQGIVSLCFDPEQLPRWRSLQEKRGAQGYPLEIWSPQQLHQRCPQLSLTGVQAAIYSPKDGQVHPQQLTLALLEAAPGLRCYWQSPVTAIAPQGGGYRLSLPHQTLTADWVIITAGLGSEALAQQLPSSDPLPMVAVAGQAMEIELAQPLGDPGFQPVLNGSDVHLVPLGDRRYWLGATVEFPPEAGPPLLEEALVEQMWDTAVGYCPAVAEAKILRRWVGYRPRPQGQGAPVIKPLCDRILLATGHYRNGVLLAPATAAAVLKQLENS